MLLAELHERHVIIEGIRIPERVINEDIVQILLAIAKGIGKLAYRAVATYVKTGFYLFAAVHAETNREHSVSDGFSLIESDLNEMKNKIDPTDAAYKNIEHVLEVVHHGKEQIQKIEHNCGEDVAKDVAKLAEDIQGKMRVDPANKAACIQANAESILKAMQQVKGIETLSMPKALERIKNDPVANDKVVNLAKQYGEKVGPALAQALALLNVAV